MRVPSRDSATGRALHTAKQLIVSFVVAAPAILGLLSDPEFKKLVLDYAPTLVPLLAFTTALVTFIDNYRRKNVKNY